jgi:hypothetical protein
VNAKAQKAPPTQLTETELRHYTPEEVVELGLLPFTPGTLRKKAQRREIPHSRAAGKITFRLTHIREIADLYDTRPIAEAKPALAA